jgi:enoyl-CoA hydratase
MTVTVTEIEGATLVKMRRPPVNAFDLAGFRELEETFRLLDQDRAVIISGTAEIFSGGVDTKAVASYSSEERVTLAKAITKMISAIMAIPSPVIAAVNGHALGGGFVFMLCADYRIGCKGTEHKYGLTEAKAGVAFPIGAASVVRHELSAPLRRQLTLSSRVVTAEFLEQHAVIDELVESDDLLRVALERAVKMSAQPAFADVKKQMRGTLIHQVQSFASKSEEPFEKMFT